MIIFGIDPGTARTGWGAIKSQKVGRAQLLRSAKVKNPRPRSAKRGGQKSVELLGYGCIVTSKDDGVGKRLLVLRKELRRLIREYKPDTICVENIFFGANARTAMMVGQARGVIILTAAECRATFFEYQGLAVKRALTGDGRADKKIVQKKVREFFKRNKKGMPFSSQDHAWDDAADALALAIYHANFK